MHSGAGGLATTIRVEIQGLNLNGLQEIFSSQENILGCSEARPAPYKMGARFIFRR